MYEQGVTHSLILVYNDVHIYLILMMTYMYILFNQEMVGGKESSVMSPHRSPPVSPRKPRSNLTRKSVSPRKSVSDFYD